jgi:hypothetical protein
MKQHSFLVHIVEEYTNLPLVLEKRMGYESWEFPEESL